MEQYRRLKCFKINYLCTLCVIYEILEGWKKISEKYINYKSHVIIRCNYLEVCIFHVHVRIVLLEVLKSYPKIEELRKCQKRVAETLSSSQASVSASKKPRLDIDDDDEEEEEDEEGVDDIHSTDVHYKKHTDLAIDVTEQFVAERLSPEFATQLVMISMVCGISLLHFCNGLVVGKLI
jgi:predicted transcriptional regulator